MTIQSLSGNFLPREADSGRSLPQTQKRASSTTNVNTEVRSLPNEEVKALGSVKLVNSLTNDTDVKPQAKIDNHIEELQQFNQNIDRSLQFKVDDELGVTIVRVIDKETEELIRQFPPEELLNLSRRLKELNEENTGNTGVLLQEKV